MPKGAFPLTRLPMVNENNSLSYLYSEKHSVQRHEIILHLSANVPVAWAWGVGDLDYSSAPQSVGLLDFGIDGHIQKVIARNIHNLK